MTLYNTSIYGKDTLNTKAKSNRIYRLDSFSNPYTRFTNKFDLGNFSDCHKTTLSNIVTIKTIYDISAENHDLNLDYSESINSNSYISKNVTFSLIDSNFSLDQFVYEIERTFEFPRNVAMHVGQFILTKYNSYIKRLGD